MRRATGSCTAHRLARQHNNNQYPGSTDVIPKHSYAEANLIRKDVNPWLKVLTASGATFCKRPQVGTFDSEEEDGEGSCIDETAIDDSSSCL